MKLRITTLLFILSVSISSYADDSKKGLYQAGTAIKLFEQVCMHTFGVNKSVFDYMKANKHTIVANPFSRQFLVGKKGTAYNANNEHGHFIVTITDDEMCTVMARKAPQNFVEAAFNMILPPPEAPVEAIKVKEGDVEPPRKQASYEFRSKQGVLLARIVLTTTTANDAFLQAMITYQRVIK